MMTVQKNSVRSQIRRVLTERILNGVYPPGSRLVELNIAKELGTSQGPVREALRELESTRLVSSEPNRGTYVRKVNPKEIREVYLIRGILEELAARTAGEKLKGHVEEIRNKVSDVLKYAELNQFPELAATVYCIHRTIVDASGNTTLLRLWESLFLETRVRIRLSWKAINREWLINSYGILLEALEKGDGNAVGKQLRNHAEFLAPAENEEEPQP